MRLSEFRVYGLFGLFNHVVPLNLDQRITIVHAPNGFGKTVILKLIAAMFGGSLATFRDVEFSRVEFHFENGSLLRVEQFENQVELFRDGSNRDARSYRILLIGGTEVLEWNPEENNADRRLSRDVSPAMWERVVPHIRRVGGREWNDLVRGDVIGVNEIIERYSDYLPTNIRRRSPQPEWLDGLRKTINCRVIETQRLLSFEKKQSSFNREEPPMTLAVRNYSSELQAAIERVLAQSATLSQSLDQTFPSRLLARMSKRSALVNEAKLRKKLSALEEQRNRLARVGLLDSAKDSTIISGSQFDNATLKILTEYVEDTTAKLAIYDDMLAKIELFLNIINSRFQFKSVSVDRNEGFKFRDIKERRLEPENLSSGEQHELVMVYDLLFKTKAQTLVLIDEPEISLHIAWQKRFLSDLRRIIELTKIDAIVSTHSPQLIGSDLDLTVQLQPPGNDVLDRE